MQIVSLIPSKNIMSLSSAAFAQSGKFKASLS